VDLRVRTSTAQDAPFLPAESFGFGHSGRRGVRAHNWAHNPALESSEMLGDSVIAVEAHAAFGLGPH
jgi:hypothetical protein